MFQFSVSLMNRLNKTESGIFALPRLISLLLKDLFFRIYLMTIGFRHLKAEYRQCQVLWMDVLFYKNL